MAAQVGLGAFNALKEKKDEIESEMSQLLQVLETQGVGMDGSLVDGDDYPRADVDIYSVRHARHRIKILQTDHRQLMRQIEEQLHVVHADARARKLSDGVSQMEVDPASSPGVAMTPFATVDHVETFSPAAQAGLQVGDQIVLFGSITAANFENLKTIGTLVQHSKGVGVRVVVTRCTGEVRLNLTPQEWAGRGLLGCNIVPLPRR